ncbi:MAG: DUF3142 domain-containing protein [Candidatus Omnitrophota bacterium]
MKLSKLILSAWLAAGGLLAFLSCGKPPPPSAWKTSFYVWREQWTEDMEPALNRAAPWANEFMIFAASFRVMGDRLVLDKKTVDWRFLSQTGKPVVLVFRLPVQFALILERTPSQTAVFLQDAIQRQMEEARAQSAAVAGTQFDYDCPTSKLKDYAALLRALRFAAPKTPLSITALPAWLESAAFADLIHGLAYYVLQVHSLEKPSSIDKDYRLCDVRQAEKAIRRAAAFGKPFYAALPTYGYQLIFDENGAFAAIASEDAPDSLPANYRTRAVFAEPEAIIPLLESLQRDPPASLVGAVWFRLPVDSDRMNWTWPTLLAVMEGRMPAMSFKAELRQPQPGLYEIWVTNSGERNYEGKIRFNVVKKRSILAYDILGNFHEDESVNSLTGPAPRAGAPALAAWYRAAPGAEGDGLPIQLGPVEAMK